MKSSESPNIFLALRRENRSRIWKLCIGNLCICEVTALDWSLWKETYNYYCYSSIDDVYVYGREYNDFYHYVFWSSNTCNQGVKNLKYAWVKARILRNNWALCFGYNAIS